MLYLDIMVNFFGNIPNIVEDIIRYVLPISYILHVTARHYAAMMISP